MSARPAPLQIEDLLDHAEWIGRLARRLVGDAHADDLVQETWLAALRTRPRTDRSLRPWLARVVRNFARQHARGARSAEQLTESSAPLPSAAELAERAEAQATLVRAVLALDEPQRSTVLLRYFEGMTSEQIASRLGVPAATVRSRLRRALDELRGRLDATAGDRGAWLAALTPLTFPAPWTVGFLAMKLSTKVGVACGLAALLAVGGYGLRRLVPASGGEHGNAPAETALETAGQGEQPGSSVDAAASPASEVARAPIPASPTTEPAASDTATWRGRLVDERTGESVPRFQLVVGQGDRKDELESDADGLFTTTTAFAAGALELRLNDHPEVARNTMLQIGASTLDRSSATSFAFDPAQAAVVHDVPIEVGPTYRLDLGKPPELALEDLVATVLAKDRTWRNYLRAVGSTPVRAGDRPWSRFGRSPRGTLENGPPWILEVRSTDGLWLGRGEVDSIVGIYPGAVHVELESRGRVVGQVLDTGGAPVADVSVSVHAGDTREATKTDERGAYTIEWVPPASYAIEAHSPRHEPVQAACEVRANEDTTHDVTLVALQRSGAISGTLASRTGEYAEPVLLVLAAKDDLARQLHAMAQWQASEDGTQHGTFAFEDVPSGDYVLWAHSVMDCFAWSPTQHAVRPPASGLELVCLDDAPTAHLSFRVLDAETGAKLDSFHLSYSANGALEMGIGMSTDAAHLLDVPTDGSLDWAVGADGYATAFGTLADFTSGGSFRTAEVQLERGWRARIQAVAPDGAAVSGVSITVDGTRVATTDEDGFATIQADARPAAIVLRTRTGSTATADSVYDLKLSNEVTVNR
ncbi:MAG: sigma-70 family RNA polymerase sigma factor [bacterium]|nr:sigma-70 family RNA polymerase sigma factor [bacterium]